MHHTDTPTTESTAPAKQATLATARNRVRRSSAYHSQRRQLRRLQRSALAVLPYFLFLIGLALASFGVLSYLENESPLALFITSRDAVHASATPGQASLSDLDQAAASAPMSPPLTRPPRPTPTGPSSAATTPAA